MIIPRRRRPLQSQKAPFPFRPVSSQIPNLQGRNLWYNSCKAAMQLLYLDFKSFFPPLWRKEKILTEDTISGFAVTVSRSAAFYAQRNNGASRPRQEVALWKIV